MIDGTVSFLCIVLTSFTFIGFFLGPRDRAKPLG